MQLSETFGRLEQPYIVLSFYLLSTSKDSSDIACKEEVATAFERQHDVMGICLAVTESQAFTGFGRCQIRRQIFLLLS